MKGYIYILECADGSLYTGSTKYLEQRILDHNNGDGANHTKKYGPCKLIYFEEYNRIDHAFYREKQIQKWSKRKKWALINGDQSLMKALSKKKFKSRDLDTS